MFSRGLNKRLITPDTDSDSDQKEFNSDTEPTGVIPNRTVNHKPSSLNLSNIDQINRLTKMALLLKNTWK